MPNTRNPGTPELTMKGQGCKPQGPGGAAVASTPIEASLPDPDPLHLAQATRLQGTTGTCELSWGDGSQILHLAAPAAWRSKIRVIGSGKSQRPTTSIVSAALLSLPMPVAAHPLPVLPQRKVVIQ